MEKRSFLGQMFQRWKAETPSFFKKLRTTGLSLAGLGGSIIGATEAFPALHLPAIVLAISTHLITWGGAMAFIASQVVKPQYTEAVKEKGPMVPTVEEIKEEKKADEKVS